MAEVFEVEGAKRGIEAEGSGCDKRVNQAQPVREVQETEVLDSLQAFNI